MALTYFNPFEDVVKIDLTLKAKLTDETYTSLQILLPQKQICH